MPRIGRPRCTGMATNCAAEGQTPAKWRCGCGASQAGVSDAPQAPSVRSVRRSELGAGEGEIPSAKGKPLDPWRVDAKRVRLSGEFVSDISKRQSGITCPRCQSSMGEIMRIAPLRTEPGLIAYECATCGKVTSEIWPAERMTDRPA